MKRKKSLSKVLCAGLAAVMTMGLCACGGDDAATSANAALAKEYVYAYEEIELPDMGVDSDMNINSVARYDGRIYMAVNIYHWDEMTGSTNETKLISMKEDGTDMQTVEIDFSKTDGTVAEDTSDETEAEDATEAESTGAGAEEAVAAGDLARTEVAVEEVAADIAIAEPLIDDSFGVDMDMAVGEDYYSQVYESTYYSNYVIGNNGTLYAVKNYYYEDYSDPNNPIYEQNYYICAWELNGTYLWQTEVENLQTEESYSYINKIIPADDGSLNLLINGDKAGVMSIDANGNFTGEKKLTNGADILERASDVIVKDDGSLIIIYYNDEWTHMYMVNYDMNADTLGEETQMPDSMMWNGYSCMTAGVGTDIVYSNSSGIFGYSVGDEQPTQIMSYINSDLNTSSMNNIIILDEAHFIGFYNDRTDNTSKGAFFTKRNPEDIPDKQVLVLAGSYIPYDMKIRVINYNKSSDQYRIVVKEYDSYNTMEDYTASYTQLNNDIITGNMPDILVAESMLPIDNYISKGLIADIGALIEKDEELSEIEYLQNVFDAYSVDEKLYYVIPSFYVQSFVAKTAMVGERESWTMQEFQEFVKTLPEGTAAISELTRTYFMNMVMQYCGSEFIDVSTGKCSFDSQEFISILEYAKTLPAELAEDYYNEDYWMNYESQYREDRAVLMQAHIASMRDMNMTMNGYFGEDVNFIGFPTATGNGSIIMGSESYVLSAKSKNLEGAWDFLRYYLTEEYQKSLEWGFPVVKSVFDEKAKEALARPYWIDENGEKVEYDNYFTINGESVILEPLNQEQLDQLIDVVTSANKRYYYNEDIQNIITEEAEAFFEGQKTAQEVVQIIQSRAQIFVDENR
uniref:ABC transporter substrate-binding protein n=1 Tax=Acetatifactor sp. TaxID=1872090 RepID=UPI004056340F